MFLKSKPRIFTEQSQWNLRMKSIPKDIALRVFFSVYFCCLQSCCDSFRPNTKRGIMVKLKILRLSLGLPALIDQGHRNFTSSQTTNYTDFLKLTRNVYNTEAQDNSSPSLFRRSNREVDGANKYEHEKLPGGWWEVRATFPTLSPLSLSSSCTPLSDFASSGNISTPRTG